MDFAEWFSRKCAETGDSPSKVSKSIGLSEAIGCYWANGSKIPRKTSIAKVEIYFGEKFNGEEIQKEKTPAQNSAEVDERLIQVFGMLTPKEVEKLLSFAQGLIAARE